MLRRPPNLTIFGPWEPGNSGNNVLGSGCECSRVVPRRRGTKCGGGRFNVSLDDMRTSFADEVSSSLSFAWIHISSGTFHILTFCPSTRAFSWAFTTMAPATSLSVDDKTKVKKAIPTSSSTNKIITATVARIYQAKPGANSCVSRFGGTWWMRRMQLIIGTLLDVDGRTLVSKEHLYFV